MVVLDLAVVGMMVGMVVGDGGDIDRIPIVKYKFILAYVLIMQLYDLLDSFSLYVVHCTLLYTV